MAEVTKPLEGAVVTKLEDIKFNEATKSMAAVAWIPLVGLILLFVEKNDKLVRYNGAQSTVIGAIELVFSIVWGVIMGAFTYSFATLAIYSLLGLVSTVISLAVLVLVVYGILQTVNGKRFDVPMVSPLALKLMDMIK